MWKRKKTFSKRLDKASLLAITEAIVEFETLVSYSGIKSVNPISHYDITPLPQVPDGAEAIDFCDACGTKCIEAIATLKCKTCEKLGHKLCFLSDLKSFTSQESWYCCETCDPLLTDI